MKHLFMMIILLGSVQGSFCCTIFCDSDQRNVLIGNNEDNYYNVEYYIKVVPKKNDQFGRLVFYSIPTSSTEVAQGGFNEYGLFFDAAVTPWDGIKIQEMEGLTPWTFDVNEGILSTCKNLDDVKSYLKKFNFNGIQGHYLVADSSGNSIIFEMSNGRSHVIEKDSRFQIATNYLLTSPNLNGSGGKDREEKVNSILNSDSNIKKETIVKALQASIQVYPNVLGTIYSNVYDLKNLVMDIYVFNNPQRAIKFNLNTELARGGFNIKLMDLFVKGKKPIYGDLIVNDVSAF